MIRRDKLFSALLIAGVFGLAGQAMAAKVTVINKDASGKGLNDATPATPVGGNPGTTRGEQARIVFEYAANMWGAVLQSDGPVDIDANFSPLECTEGRTVLGQTGTNGYMQFTDPAKLPDGAVSNMWYPGSLANALTGGDASPGRSEMSMSFNGALGTATCLPDSGWYFGLDGKAPAGKSNLLNVMLHEMGHGLGFAGRSNLGTGGLAGGVNDIYSSFAFDNTINKAWGDMSNAERAKAALDDGNLVFRGPNVVAEATLVLSKADAFTVSAPASVAGTYDFIAAAAPADPHPSNFSGNVVAAVSNPGEATDGLATEGCLPFTNAADVAGRIVLVDRGTCSFDIKIGNAIAAGATGAIIANNVDGTLSPAISLALPTITVTRDVGAKLRSGLDGLEVSLKTGDRLAGTDEAGNVQLFAPTELIQGSSFSHYDVRLSPNALMEFAESADLKGHINLDLTPALYKDEGWKLHETGQMLLTCDTGVPTWVPGGAVIGANVYATARLLAATSADFDAYKAGMLAHADELASQELVDEEQASTLNACLGDEELQAQFREWGNGVGLPDGGDGDIRAVELTKGVILGNQSGVADSETLYKLEVPAGALGLTLRTLGGTGDVSMFVKIGGEPSVTDNDFKSVHAGNNESIAVARPVAGTYYVKLVGVSAYAGVSVQGSFVKP